MRGAYRLVRTSSDAGTFHRRAVPDPAPFEVWWHEVTRPALVLGSTQSGDDVDHEACARGGVDVVRRRSGGGAVLLIPGEVTWIDVIVPSGSPGWSDDVHGPMVWLGERIAAEFAGLVAERSIEVHRGALRRSPRSATICFDGLGAGEVVADGAKLVGISQRRTRSAARLQCCWYTRYDPVDLLGLLAPRVRPAVDELGPVATVSPSVAEAVPTALVARLG